MNAIERLGKCTKLEQVKFETEPPGSPCSLNRRVVDVMTRYTK